MGVGHQTLARVGAVPNAAGGPAVESRTPVPGAGYAAQAGAMKPGRTGYASQANALSAAGPGGASAAGAHAAHVDPRASTRAPELTEGQCAKGIAQCKDGELVDPATIKELKRRTLEKSPHVDMLWDDRVLLMWSANGSAERDGVILLDNRADWESLTEDLVHELVHRANNHIFETNAKEQTREEFVETKLDDEITAEAFTFVWKIQQGHRTGGASFTLFLKHLETNNGRWDDPIALEAEAKAFLSVAYQTGALRTPTTGQKYADYHGQAWDREQPSDP